MDGRPTTGGEGVPGYIKRAIQIILNIQSGRLELSADADTISIDTDALPEDLFITLFGVTQADVNALSNTNEESITLSAAASKIIEFHPEAD